MDHELTMIDFEARQLLYVLLADGRLQGMTSAEMARLEKHLKIFVRGVRLRMKAEVKEAAAVAMQEYLDGEFRRWRDALLDPCKTRN